MRAGVCTFPTLKAFSGAKNNVSFGVLGLRIVAERTLQGASLEKDYTCKVLVSFVL